MTTVNVYVSDRRDPRRRRACRVLFRLGLPRDASGPAPDRFTCCRPIRGVPDVATEILTEQFVDLSVQFLDRRGHPAPVDGVSVWATDDSDLLLVEPAADGMSCKVTTKTMPGVAHVQVTADADMGAGVRPVVGVVEFVVKLPEAETVTVTVGTPQDA